MEYVVLFSLFCSLHSLPALLTNAMAWDAYAVIIPPCALLACIASVPLLVIHFKAKNIAVTVLALGSVVLNLQNFVNALLWGSKNPTGWWDGHILCDIEIKLYIGIGVAVDGAVASIFRQIAIILDTEHMTVTASRQERMVRLAFEIWLCIVLPTCVMAAHYLIQDGRYWLRPSAGCTPSYDNNWATPLLSFLWPVVSCLIGSVYCCISIYRLWMHRREMASILSNTPGITSSRFSRLFAVAFVLLITYCPLAVYAFAENLSLPMHKYSWSYIHQPDWSSMIIFRPSSGRLTFDRWGQIATGYLLFGFLGLGKDAVQLYQSWLEAGRHFLIGCFKRGVRHRMRAKQPSPSISPEA